MNRDDEHLIVDGKLYWVFTQKDPARLPWAELGVDLVLECTGAFRRKAVQSARNTHHGSVSDSDRSRRFAVPVKGRAEQVGDKRGELPERETATDWGALLAS